MNAAPVLQSLVEPPTPASWRHLVKLAMAVVMKQMIAADRGDENIGQPVIVVIPDGHAHAIELTSRPEPLVTSVK